MTTLDINTTALKHNTKLITELAGKATVIAVLKGNAYGLGLCEFAAFLKQQGIHHFAVTDLADALTLRKNHITGDILMLTPLYDEGDILSAISHDITLSITSYECGIAADAAAAQFADANVRAHLCIDTGFGRYGFLSSEPSQIIHTVNQMNHIKITGIFSHLHAACCKDSSFTRCQFDEFLALCDNLENSGINVGMRHISSTTALIRFPDMRLDAVRIGSAFLGRIAIPNKYTFIPIGALSAQVDDIYSLPAGHNVGYGHSFITSRTTTTAVVSAGYYHGLGLERHTSPSRPNFLPFNIVRAIKKYTSHQQITAFYKETPLSILGQIGMNSVIVDITDCGVSVGDKISFQINPLYVNSNIPRHYY